MKTVTISHDHNVICPVDTAGVCTWIMSVSTGEVWASFRDAAGKRVLLNHSPSNHRRQDLFFSSSPEETGQEEGKQQNSAFERAACSSPKVLQFTRSPALAGPGGAAAP